MRNEYVKGTEDRIYKKETEGILYFIHRMPMFISPINRDTIISFIHGLDVGRNSDLSWTDLIKSFMTNVHDIPTGSLGWVYQIDEYSKRNDLNWENSIRKLIQELIEYSPEIEYPEDLKQLNETFIKKKP